MKSYTTKVYYDDTDAAGVMYYANYLKLCERAKQEFFLMKNCDLFKLHNEGIYLVVKDVHISYIKSVQLGETVDIYVDIMKRKNASILLHFDIKVENDTRARVDILHASIDKSAKILKLPECIK